MAKSPKAKVRPLMIREGARYRCFGDGLCCTNIHGLGPLTEREVKAVRRIDKRGAAFDDDFEDYMLCTAADGGCHFLMEDNLCAIHAQHGAEHKPHGCRAFPFGLSATPEGGRITTEHRCPCRTMGERPSLDIEAALPSIVEASGRPEADRRVNRVKLRKGEKVTFDKYLAVEAPMLRRLLDGEDPMAVLDAEPFPRLRESSWPEQIEEFVEAKDGTRFGDALALFGDTMNHLLTGGRPRPPMRTWADAFDRSEARSHGGRTEREIFCDWIADEIWSLKWTEDRSFDAARRELATRMVVGGCLSRRWREEGGAEERAAAEAVMVVELIGESDYWKEVVSFIEG